MIGVIAVWIAAGVSTAQASVTWVPENDGSGAYRVEVKDLELRTLPEERGEEVSVSLLGAEGYDGRLQEEGNPDVPVVRFYIDGEANIEVMVSEEKAMTRQRLPGDLAPIQLSPAKVPGSQGRYFRNSAAYTRRAPYPTQEFEIVEAGRIRGQQRRLVTLYPAAYQAATRTMTLKRGFTVKVKPVAQPPLVERKKTFALVVGAPFVGTRPVERYARFKRAAGWNVVEIAVGANARTPEEIRARLMELYSDSALKLEYVMLLGDLQDVPARGGKFLDDGVTDHYYRVLDTPDYESDVNGPDVSVGRFPAATEQQLGAMVDKTIRFAQNTRQEGEVFGQVAWLATDDSSWWELVEATHNYVISNHFATRSYRGYFPQAAMAGGDHLYAITHHASGEDALRAIREGRALVHYSGHGLVDSWDQPNMTQEDVRSLDSEATPIVISNSCLTGDFRAPESFAETWLRHPQGAVFFWGSMDLTYWAEDDVLERRQYDGVFQQGKRTLAQITEFALSEVWRHFGGRGRSRYYWETYGSFGDPSLQYLPRR